MEHISENGIHELYDADPHFAIDPDTRVLSYESPEKLTLIQGDHNSQIFTFEIPRYVDGHDMSLCDSVQAHYINISSEDTQKRSVGLCKITDLQLHPDAENLVVFSWPVSGNATKYAGSLNFLIRLACTDGSKITYVWNTAVYTGVSVSTGMDNSETIIDGNADILEEWYWNLVAAGTTSVNAIEDAKQAAIDYINTEKHKALDKLVTQINMYGGIECSDTEPTNPLTVVWYKVSDATLRTRNIETGEWEPVNVLEGDLHYIVQELGDQVNRVVSQKIVTEYINKLTGDIGTINTSLSKLESIVDKNDKAVGTFTAHVIELDEDLANLRKEYKSDFFDLSVDIKKRVSVLEGKNESYNESITDLRDRVGKYGNLVDTIIDVQSPISSLIRRIESLETDDRIDTFLEEYTTHVSEFATVKTRLDDIASYHGRLQFEIIPSLEAVDHEYGTRLNTVEQFIDGMPTAEQTIESINKANDCAMQMESLDARISVVESAGAIDVTDLKNRVESAESTIGSFHSRMDSFSDRIDSLESGGSGDGSVVANECLSRLNYITLPDSYSSIETPGLASGETSIEHHIAALWWHRLNLNNELADLRARVEALENAS